MRVDRGELDLGMRNDRFAGLMRDTQPARRHGHDVLPGVGDCGLRPVFLHCPGYLDEPLAGC